MLGRVTLAIVQPVRAAGARTVEADRLERGAAPPSAVTAVLAWGAWALVMSTLVAIVWLDHLLRRAGRSDLTLLATEELLFPVGIAASATMGAIVAWRTRHAVSWMLIGLAASVALCAFAEAYAAYGVLVRPGSLPAASWVAPFSEALFWPAFTFLAFILLLTPSGHLPSHRWRPFAALVAGGSTLWTLSTVLGDDPLDEPMQGLANPWAIDVIQGPIAVAAVIGIAVTHGGVLVAGGSLVRRFRRADGVERQQLRWVAFGAVVAAVAVVGAFASALTDQDVLLDVTAATLVTVLPLSVTIAISRYRLYDLDRVISRSLVYAALTGMVAATYIVVVAGLGLVAGSDRVVSGIAAVVAAMAVAPMRSIAQRGADRLLFGRRAEPFAVVSGLSQRLQASASPETALQTLVDTVATDLRLPFVCVESISGGVLAVRGVVDTTRRIRLPLSHQGEDVGALVLGLRRGEDEFDLRERALLDDLARHAGAAVHSAALVRDLYLARHRLVATREEERRRLRRDLHDGLGPQLTAVTLKLDAARNLLPRDPGQADAVLIELRSDVKAAIDDIRRVVYALRPPGLDELGLLGALRQHARTSTPGAITPEITVSGADLEGLPAPVEVAAYRIATEAITNAVRHAKARHCHVSVELDGDLTVEIIDDGIGLPSRWRAGVGITSMRERAGELGGSCALERSGGSGTKVVARLPLVTAAL